MSMKINELRRKSKLLILCVTKWLLLLSRT